MSEFKKSVYASKIKHTEYKKKRKEIKSRKYKSILHGTIYVTLIGVFRVFIYFMVKSENKDNLQTTIDPKPDLIISEGVDMTGKDNSIVVKSASVYYTKFVNVINEFSSKIELTCEKKIIPRESYIKELTKYAETSMSRIRWKKKIIIISNLVDSIKLTIEPLTNITSDPTLELQTYRYYRVLFIYFQVLYTASNVADSVEYVYRPTNEQESDRINLNTKFIFQQLLLKEILHTLSLINKEFGETIRNKLNFKETKQFITIRKAILYQQDIIEKEMFVKCDGQIEFKLYGEEVKVEYLISHINYSIRFISLNMLLILMHIFEIDKTFHVPTLSTDATKVIKEFLQKGNSVIGNDENVFELSKQLAIECKTLYMELAADYDDLKKPHFLKILIMVQGDCLEMFHTLIQRESN